MSSAPGAPNSVPALAVKNLVKHYGSSYALRGISLQVEAGECVSIFGPNGAGKSTLLRILAEITRPTSGEILIHGQPLHKRPLAARRQLGVIGHQTFLYDDLSAAENLMFFARLYDVADPRARVAAVLADVGLEKRSDDRVRGFSRGMQQRLAIGRAMLHDPSILFLDEPYTGLDQHAATMLTHWIKRVRGERRTILLVTHDLAQGLAMADRAMVFLQGKVAWQGATAPLGEKEFSSLYFDLVAKGER